MYVWMYVCTYESLLVDLRFRSPIGVTAAVPLQNIKLASCLKLSTKESNWIKKARGNSTEKII